MKSNTILSLFGYSVIPLALLLAALLIIDYGDSTTQRQDNIMRLLTPPSAEIK